MIKAYDEIIDFIAAGSTPQAVVDFRASEATKNYIAELIESEKVGTLTDEQHSELENFMRLEHIMRIAKAKARLNTAE